MFYHSSFEAVIAELRRILTEAISEVCTADV